jgi:AcrR family transcriptional regulator
LCIWAYSYHMTTKDLILSEARKVFEKFGFNKTSMADIALAARKGRRTIYSYFTSKEEVFKAVIEVEIDALAKTLQELIDSPLKADEKLRQYMQTRMNTVKMLTIYYDAIRRDLVENLAFIEKIRKKYDEMEMEMIRKILDEGVAQNVFEIKDTKIVAGAIVLASKGFELPLIMGQEGYDHGSMIEPLIDVFYKGILKK